MYYASFGILAVIHHIIINYDVLKNGRKEPSHGPHFRYRQFLNAILVFYLADIAWGFFAESGIMVLAYADTVIFFASMALSVLLWTRYVVAFLDKKGVRSQVFIAAGWSIFGFVILHLIINFFKPNVFEFTEDVQYVAGPTRHFLLAAQFLLFVLISVYSLFVSIRSEGRDKVHYRAVCLSGGVMAVFIILQSFDAYWPLYTIGCFLANCLMHVFVEEDEKKEKNREKEEAEQEREIYNHISNILSQNYEAIYYVDIETGKYREISASEIYESMNVTKEYEDFFEDTKNNINKYVHPDDRTFALNMFNKDVMLAKLKGRKSFSYKYRIMVNDEVRYFRFTVMFADDKKHFIILDKDIHDTITAETEMREKQKVNITFSQIAESLASNYDVIYYVNSKNGDYIGYTSQNIYGKLRVNESGEDFFGASRKNVSLLIHPQDRERVMQILDIDYLISVLEGRKEYNIEYRLIVDDKSQHTRMSIRKSSDGQHFIIGIENIEEEVQKEKEHLKALNTQKELARKDELTGLRNKMAFTELQQSIQDNLDKGMNYIPFALAICDLNDLKKVNDTEGHKAGDDYIKASAKLLCDIFDHSPVFRIGGDEFAIFLSGSDFSLRQELVAKLHRHSIENIDKYNGPVIAIGLTEYIRDTDTTFTEVFERADKLMYEDKRELKLRAGKNEVR
ncbi:MAG: diguanylate cyclase [Lachnospiraceae bacterium]|nr:diguanylate cyclase [Lachnospiraceae bacterium]